MVNRVIADAHALRRAVHRLIDQGRYRLTVHARTTHLEIPDIDKTAVVRYGGMDRPDKRGPPQAGVYVCWARHPVHGLCRGVYAIERHEDGDVLVIITAFRE